MKKLFIIRIITALFIVLSAAPTAVSASPAADLQNTSAQTLVRLKILEGYEDGSLRLDNKIKRSEFITIVVRILGYNSTTDTNDVNISFKDISKNHWAYPNIKIAYKYGLVDGYPDNSIAPDKFVTYAEALSVLVKALGYKDTLVGIWPANVLDKSSQLGIDKGLIIPQDRQITRGEIAILVNNSLMANLNQ